MIAISHGSLASPPRCRGPGRCASLVVAAVLVAAPSLAGGQPAPASQGPESTNASEVEPLLGTYRAVDTSEQAATIDRAIETGTEEMGPVRRRVGRKRLHAVNVPVRVLRISREGDRVVTDFDGDRYPAPVSGATQRTQDPEGEPVDVSYRVVGGSLRGRYVGPDGEKIISFAVDDDGRLTMHVTLLSDQLPEPIRYRLAFRKE